MAALGAAAKPVRATIAFAEGVPLVQPLPPTAALPDRNTDPRSIFKAESHGALRRHARALFLRQPPEDRWDAATTCIVKAVDCPGDGQGGTMAADLLLDHGGEPRAPAVTPSNVSRSFPA